MSISENSLGQTDTCLCGDAVKGVLILKNNYEAEVKAHDLDKKSLDLARENEYDLKQSRDKCYSAYSVLEEAFKVEQAKPKIIQEIHSNREWYLFFGGGAILGGVIVWAIEHFIIK